MSGSAAIPPGVIDAAVKALTKAALLNNAGYLEGDEEAAARVVLEAAGPLLAAAQREADAQLMDKHGAHYGCYVSIGDTVTSGLRPAADLLRGAPNPWLPGGATESARRAEEIHAEHHPGTFVPSLDSCPEHARAEYEALVTDLIRKEAPDGAR